MHKVIIRPELNYTSRMSVDDIGRFIATDVHNETDKIVSYVTINLTKQEAIEVAAVLLKYAEVSK